MKDQFRDYFISLYQGIPTEVYEGLISFLCIGIVGLFVIVGWKKGWRKVAGLILAEYVFLIYCSTIIYRTVAERFVGYCFTPFWSYSAIVKGREDLLAENIMNVVVFVPVGLLLSCVSHQLKWWMILLIGLGISVSIETLQYFFHKGFSEVDDVIHNTFGCAIGIMIVAMIKGIWLLQKRYLMS